MVIRMRVFLAVPSPAVLRVPAAHGKQPKAFPVRDNTEIKDAATFAVIFFQLWLDRGKSRKTQEIENFI